VSRAEYSLICDHPSCTRQLGAAANDDDRARLRLLATAREAGWSVDGADHWCPDHREATPP